MKLASIAVTALLEQLRSPAPTPGGGSASALAGAAGASLLAMVAALPKPLASSERELAELRAAATRSTELAKTLEALIDADADAYQLVVSAYQRPKSTDDERRARSAAIQDALVAATAAPLEVMRACAEAVDQGDVVARHGNRNASSDVQVGLELLSAGLRGARLNVEINLGSVKDTSYVERTRAEVAALAAACDTGVATARSRFGAG